MKPEEWTERERELFKQWRDTITDMTAPGYVNVHRLSRELGDVPHLQVR
jgi:hypothetical protein